MLMFQHMTAVCGEVQLPYPKRKLYSLVGMDGDPEVCVVSTGLNPTIFDAQHQSPLEELPVE